MVELTYDEFDLLISLIPTWARNTVPGLDSTMYGTGTYKGDVEIVDKVDKLLAKWAMIEPERD